MSVCLTRWFRTAVADSATIEPAQSFLASQFADQIMRGALGGRLFIGNSHDRVADFFVLCRLFGSLYLNNIELLWAIEAEQCGFPFEDLHDQQPGLGINLLGRAIEEHFQQLGHGIFPSFFIAARQRYRVEVVR